MSDEPEVTPLRLKRPGAGGGTPPGPGEPASSPPPPPPLFIGEVPPVAPLVPLPGLPTATPPPPAAGPSVAPDPASPAAPAAPERLRRRPSLASEAAPAPAIPAPATPPPPAPPPLFIGEVPPAASSPVVPLPFASSAPPRPPAPAPAAAPTETPAGNPGGVKLKIGVKPPAPPPPPAADSPTDQPPIAPLPPLFAPAPGGAGADPASGAPPLMPLPGMPTVPPAPGGAHLPPLPTTPMMTAGVPMPPPLGGTRPPIHLRAEAPAEALDPSKLPAPLPAARARAAVAGKGSAQRDALIFGLAFLVIAGLGGGAYYFLTGSDRADGAASEVRAKLEEAAKLPGKAVDNAKQSIAGAREKEQARIDAAAEGKETPTERAVGNVTPGELQTKLQENNPPPAKIVVETAPALVPPPTVLPPSLPPPPVAEKPAEPVAPPPPPPANPRFVRYAEALRVSGVFQGNPARALVDGRLVRSGDVIEPNLGITFTGVDADTKHLILQDATGAQVRVKY